MNAFIYYDTLHSLIPNLNQMVLVRNLLCKCRSLSLFPSIYDYDRIYTYYLCMYIIYCIQLVLFSKLEALYIIALIYSYRYTYRLIQTHVGNSWYQHICSDQRHLIKIIYLIHIKICTKCGSVPQTQEPIADDQFYNYKSNYKH